MWDPNLETGVREIDAQHCELFEMLQQMEDMIAAQEGPAADLSDLLRHLQAYVMFHFDNEERLMSQLHSKAGLTHMTKHYAEHRKFADKVAEIRQSLLSNPQQTLPDLAKFVRTWLQQHIRIVDKELVTLLAEGKSQVFE